MHYIMSCSSRIISKMTQQICNQSNQGIGNCCEWRQISKWGNVAVNLCRLRKMLYTLARLPFFNFCLQNPDCYPLPQDKLTLPFLAYKSSSTSSSKTNQIIVKFTAVCFITTEGIKVRL